MRTIDVRGVRTWTLLKWISATVLFACLLSLWHAVLGAEVEQDFTGQLLVATEEMKDPRFLETVIYIVKHGAEGTLGLVINRPLATGPIDDLLKGFGGEPKGSKREVLIYYGGPVSSLQGFVLHSDDVELDSSTKVRDGIAMTSDIKMIEAIASGQGPKESLIMLGYVGWAPGQLEGEIKDGAWFVIPSDKALVFGKDAEKKWRRAMDRRQTPL
ncbi:MAG TPA: YqgE/AlgH family protein [Candidatus Binatia bacterium]|jgi:putative transcriptional regulator